MATQRKAAQAPVSPVVEKDEAVMCTVCDGSGIVKAGTSDEDVCAACNGEGSVTTVAGEQPEAGSLPPPTGEVVEGQAEKTVVGVSVPLDEMADADRIAAADKALANLIDAARSLRQQHVQNNNGYVPPRIFVENVMSAVWKFDHIVNPCSDCDGKGATEDGGRCALCEGDGLGDPVNVQPVADEKE